MNKLIIVLIVTMIIAVVGFVLSGVVNATAQKSKLEDSINQTNSTQSERQKIIVTWLETNDTKTSSDTPVISINNEDFWKIFELLVNQSMNGSS
jgi:FtsZ-interacting cell division protein ZipA